MELSQLNQRIAVVNAESKRINNDRQVNIGKRSTLEKQLSEALKAYKQNYGVELTVETLAAEMNRVATAKEAEVSALENVIGLIKAGNYDEANKVIGGSSTQPETVAQPEVTVAAPEATVAKPEVTVAAPEVAPTPQPVPAPQIFVAQPEVAQVPQPIPAPAPQSAPAPQPIPVPTSQSVVAPKVTVAQPIVQPVPQPVPTPQPVVQSLSGLDTSKEDKENHPILGNTPATGIGGSQPAAPADIPMSFNAILNGMPFQK